MQIVNRHARMKTKRVRNSFSPWLSPELKERMHQRDHLERIAIISGKETERNWAAYKHTKNSLIIAVKISKASYYRNYFLQNKGNIRETWRGINTILSKNTKTTSFPAKIEGINSANLSPNDMSSAFNNHFVEVWPNLESRFLNPESILAPL